VINPYTFPIKGDISRADAVVLCLEARKASRAVFEFGVGGSTILLSGSTNLPLVSFEHSSEWLERTKTNITMYQKHLMVTPQFEQVSYQQEHLDKTRARVAELLLKYKPSFVFLDGEIDPPYFCRPYCFDIVFPLLSVGSTIMIHDFRRPNDQRSMAPMFLKYMNEIESIFPNYLQSNMCLIKKGEKVAWENWNVTEGHNHRVDWFSDGVGIK
jgi:hypothetical protein